MLGASSYTSDDHFVFPRDARRSRASGVRGLLLPTIVQHLEKVGMRGLFNRNLSSIRSGMIFRFPLTPHQRHWYLHIFCQQFPLSKSTGESELTGIESLHGTAWCLRVRITESQSVAITEDSRREPEKDWLKARSLYQFPPVLLEEKMWQKKTG